MGINGEYDQVAYYGRGPGEKLRRQPAG
ncbi:hypothetical protein ACLK15_17850 [Escherichia coli]